MISKKDLLIQTNISYGQLYRWKREGLIPEEWFVKTSTQTGQETFFDEDLIIPRINKILDLKDEFSIDDIKNILNQYHGIVNAASLIQDGCIKPDLQTAVYLFATNKDKYSKHNWVNLDLILKI